MQSKTSLSIIILVIVIAVVVILLYCTNDTKPGEAFGGALGTIIAVFIGGAITHCSSAVQWKRQSKSERNKVFREKLEEACTMVVKIEAGLTFFSATINTRSFGLDISELDRQKDKDRIPLDYLKMLVSLYFQELLPNFERIETSRNRIGNCYVNTLGEQANNSGAEVRTDLKQSMQELQSACAEFLKQAAIIINRMV